MSDPRWIDVHDDAALAAEHFRFAVALFEAGGFEDGGLEGYRARMAFMHAVQSGHTTLEGLLLRILDVLKEERPTGDKWHRDLIRRVCRDIAGSQARPPILSEFLCEAIDETRRFRNLAVHNYDGFRADKASATVAAASLIAELLVAEITSFKEVADADRHA